MLGGLGPAATLDFFAKVLQQTPAASDQDHLHLIIDNNPQVPDRSAAVAGSGPSPAPVLAEMARRLERAGADFLVMPCNSAHAFADAIEGAVSIPFVNIIKESRDEVARCFPKVERVGVLATNGCLDAGLYQRAFAERSIEVVVPDGTDRETLMQLIYQTKAGERAEHIREGMRGIAERLVERGAEVLVAGCTEVPLVLLASEVSRPLVNSTDVLVAKTIDYAEQISRESG